MKELIKLIETHRKIYYDDCMEIVLDNDLEWDDVFLENDYTPSIESTDLYAFEHFKGAYVALDNILKKMETMNERPKATYKVNGQEVNTEKLFEHFTENSVQELISKKIIEVC